MMGKSQANTSHSNLFIQMKLFEASFADSGKVKTIFRIFNKLIVKFFVNCSSFCSRTAVRSFHPNQNRRPSSFYSFLHPLWDLEISSVEG